MEPKPRFRVLMVAILSIGLAALGSSGSRAGELEDRDSMWGGRDSLFVGEASDNTVRRFDAKSGRYEGVFVKEPGSPPGSIPGRGDLNGPRGLLFSKRGDLLVVNQNVAECPPDWKDGDPLPPLPPPGEVLRYSGKTGEFLGKIVASDDLKLVRPAWPRGMVLWEDNVLFVADFSTTLTPCPAPLEPGRILAYRLKERERHAGLKVGECLNFCV